MSLRESIYENGFLAKITATIVITVSTIGLISNLNSDTINNGVSYVLTSILSFACGYLFSKRDKI